MKTCGDTRTTCYWLGERRRRKGGRPRTRCAPVPQVALVEKRTQASASAEFGMAVTSFLSQQPPQVCVACRSPMPWKGVMTCPSCGVKRWKRPCLQHLVPYVAEQPRADPCGAGSCDLRMPDLAEEMHMQDQEQGGHTEDDEALEVGMANVEASWLSVSSSPRSHNSRSSSLELVDGYGDECANGELGTAGEIARRGGQEKRRCGHEHEGGWGAPVETNDFSSLLYDSNSIARLIQTDSPLEKIVRHGPAPGCGSPEGRGGVRRCDRGVGRRACDQESLPPAGEGAKLGVVAPTQETAKRGGGQCDLIKRPQADRGQLAPRGRLRNPFNPLKKVMRWAQSLAGVSVRVCATLCVCAGVCVLRERGGGRRGLASAPKLSSCSYLHCHQPLK